MKGDKGSGSINKMEVDELLPYLAQTSEWELIPFLLLDKKGGIYGILSLGEKILLTKIAEYFVVHQKNALFANHWQIQNSSLNVMGDIKLLLSDGVTF